MPRKAKVVEPPSLPQDTKAPIVAKRAAKPKPIPEPVSEPEVESNSETEEPQSSPQPPAPKSKKAPKLAPKPEAKPRKPSLWMQVLQKHGFMVKGSAAFKPCPKKGSDEYIAVRAAFDAEKAKQAEAEE